MESKGTTHRFTTEQDRQDCANGIHEPVDAGTDGQMVGEEFMHTQRCAWCDATRQHFQTMTSVRFGEWSK